MINQRIGAEKLVLLPKSWAIPGKVKMTRSQAFYESTGLLEERITLETVDQGDWLKLPRHGQRKMAVL
jgi:hypothetical protein